MTFFCLLDIRDQISVFKNIETSLYLNKRPCYNLPNKPYPLWPNRFEKGKGFERNHLLEIVQLLVTFAL